MALDERVIIEAESMSVHAPADSEPDWIKTDCLAMISTTSWPFEDRSEPSVHALLLSRTDAKLVVDELTKLLKEA